MSQNEVIQENGKESNISQLFNLDFDGAETSYINRDLGISIDNVSVSASGIDSRQIATIVNALNTRFSGEAFFSTIRPDEGEYSTIYIGLTSAFDEYGQFQGIAENVDAGNKIHDDNAFVLLDARATTEQITSVIAHEAGHLLGNVEHGGEELKRYALDTSVSNGQVSSGIPLQEGDSLRVSSGGTVENTTVNECCTVYVYEGGTANNTTVNEWGEIYVYEGGTANSTTVNEGGWFEVYSGGTAHSGTISSGGTMWVDGGGTADEIVVSNGGYVRVFEGASATGLAIEDGGALDFTVVPETWVQWTSGGSEFNMESGFLSEYVLNSGAITVSQDGIVDCITVNPGGELWVDDGGMAMQIIENGGFVWFQEGAGASFDTNTFSGVVLEKSVATVHMETTALDTTINDQGVMSMFEGGSASGVVVNQGGMLEISSGGIATGVMENGGFVWVNEGASATFVSNAINNLELGLKEGEEPPYLEVYEENASLHSGTTATSTTIYNRGRLHICEGGAADDTVVSSGGEIFVYEGGIANGITANDACWITLKDGATVSGQIDLNGTSVILVQGDVYAEDAVFNFHFDTQTPEDDYLLYFIDQYWYEFDGIGKLFGGSFAITIGPSLDCGVYKFIAGAMDFDVTFAVLDAESQSIGELEVDGDILAYGGLGYYLTDDGENNITLNVVDAEETDIVPPVITGIAADVTSATNGTVTVTATASDNSGEFTLYYIKDGGALTVYDDGVLFTANGSVIFKAVDAAGNETFSDEFVVSNIDNVAPVISDIAADVTEPTNGTVKVTATASDDSGEVLLYYAKDGGDFIVYQDGVVFTENGSVVFKAADAVGNETLSDEFAVANIDTTAPVISDIAADVTAPTNGTVTVTATASDDSGEVSLYYSKDGGDFIEYEEGVAFTANGSVVFKAVDAAGNETLSDEFVVSNIDTVAPVISDITADVAEPTNGTVTVTATASDDSGEVSLYYSKDGGDFIEYEEGVAFTANGSVVFKAVDAAGNETVSDEFLVSNIDNVAPVISDIAADVTEPTNGAVKVTATASDDSGEVALYYSKDGGDFTAYENGVVFTENGSLVFKAVDEAGNETLSNVFEVLNIDTVAPVISDIVADVTAPTNGSVKVTATASDNSGQVSLYYAKDGGMFTAYENGVEFTANGSVVFKAIDAAGNEATSDEFQVTNIDTVAPAVSSLTIAEPDENGDIAVSIEASEALSQLSYSWNEGEWTDYPEGLLKFNEGGSIRFRLVDLAGNETITDTYHVASNDDWTDLATNGDKSNEIGYFGEAEKGTTKQNEVGKDDLIDYMAITLSYPTLLSFTVNSDNKTKFSLLQLQGGNGKYSLKSIKNGSVTTPGKSIVVSTDNPLGAGTYYISMEATDKKAANAPYTITLNDNSIFYSKADNSDDWTKYDKKRTSDEDHVPDLGTVKAAGTLVEDGWVGYGDVIDYSMFTLDVHVQMILNVEATDASKFILSKLQCSSSGKYSFKSMSSTALKLDKATKQYTLTTKKLLLEPGIYYLCMQSTNKKKGNADYSISIAPQSIFCTKADNSDDKPDKKKGTTWAGITADLGAVNAPGMLVEDGWVGFGDATDVAAFTLETAAIISFDLTASDKSKFVIFKVTDQNTANGKALQTTTLKLDKTKGQYAVTSKSLKMEAGTYYLMMEATDAKKGSSVDYSISVSNDSIFFTKGDKSDDMPDSKYRKTASLGTVAVVLGTVTAPGVLVHDGWVGYGDVTDVAAFTLDGAATLSFDLTASSNCKFVIYKETENNGKYTLKTLQTTSIKKNPYNVTTNSLKLAAGTYYLVMEATTAKKGSSVDYTISVNENSVFANANQQFGAAAPNDNLAMGYLDFQLEDENGCGLVLEDKAEITMASLENSGEVALPQLTTFGDAPEFANNQEQCGDCLLGISGTDEQKYNDGLGMGMLA